MEAEAARSKQAWDANGVSAAEESKEESKVGVRTRAVHKWLSEHGFLDADEHPDPGAVSEWLDHAIAARGLKKNTAFFDACRDGELEVCKWLFEHGAAEHVRLADSFARSPMFVACYRGRLAVCQWLFDHGAADDVRTADDLGWTPMMASAMKGHLNVCDWLFDHGAAGDVTQANGRAETPMLLACFHGSLDMCCWLADHGATSDIMTPRLDGSRPMDMSIHRGDAAMCEWLRNHGADVPQYDVEDKSYVLMACQHGHFDVAKWLSSHAVTHDELAAEDEDGHTPLSLACGAQDVAACQWIVRLNPETLDHDDVRANMTPTVHAALVEWCHAQLTARATFTSVVLCAMTLERGGNASLAKLAKTQAPRRVAEFLLGSNIAAAAQSLHAALGLLRRTEPNPAGVAASGVVVRRQSCGCTIC